ncbi:peptidoglycan DD-metalloendopeptidase family protein [Streptomyces sp. NPDC051940]|uniref:M23 family metallopeptidase n=1 Tax=Streptomyces sp. NPDC051940 TaxID=3155675 RepID=UPI00342DAB3B
MTVPTAAAEGPAPGDDDKNTLQAAKREVDRLFTEAGRITQQYESARRAVTRQQTKIDRLAVRVRDQQRRLSRLRGELGRVAAQQYRTGGEASAMGSTAQFMLSDDPSEFLDRVYLADKGERAAGQLLHHTRMAEARLEAEKARAGQAQLELEHELYVQQRAKQALEQKLLRARTTLERLEATALAAARKRSGGCAEWVRSVPFSVGAGDTADGKPFVASNWLKPVDKYEITSRFAQTGEHWGSLHTGLDFAADEGRPVRSVGFGTVYELGCDGAFGNSVTIRHDDGYYTFYAHLSEIDAKPGERVFPGQHIGRVGSTGNSTGPHLHFEVRVTPLFGSGIDPEPWLRAKGVTP